MNANTDNAETLQDTAPTRCACHAYEVVSWTGEVPEGADPGDYAKYQGTGCTQYTRRVFAPGHDAKLKSLLIQAGAAGQDVARHDAGMSTYASAENVAQSFGFEFQVLAGIKRAQAKAQERADKKAAKAAKKAEPRAPRTQAEQVVESKGAEVTARIKVGRHFYDAVIQPDGVARYKTAKGDEKTVAEGKYSLAPETK